MDQGGFFAADKSPCSQNKGNIEREGCSEDIGSQEIEFLCLGNRYFQAFHGKGVFRADIDDTLVGTHSKAADGHGLQYGKRIAFNDTSVHESSRVSLVGIADQVFFLCFLICHILPFDACRKTSAATTAQTGFGYFINHTVRRILGQDFCQRLVSADGQVIVDVFRVNHSAVTESHAFLFFKVIDISKNKFGFVRQIIGAHFSEIGFGTRARHIIFDQVIPDDFFCFFYIHIFIFEGNFSCLIHLHCGFQMASSHASLAGQMHVLDFSFFDFLFKDIPHHFGSCGNFTGGHADCNTGRGKPFSEVLMDGFLPGF